MGRGIQQNHRLDRRGQNRDKTCSSESCRAVATKLRAARHLSAYAADVAQRSVQVIHECALYTAKYPEATDLSRYPIRTFSRVLPWEQKEYAVTHLPDWSALAESVVLDGCPCSSERTWTENGVFQTLSLQCMRILALGRSPFAHFQ